MPSGAIVGSRVDGITPSENGRAAAPPFARVLERALEVLDRVAELDRAGVTGMQLGTGIGDEVGELRERDVDLHHAAAAPPRLEVAHEVARELRSIDLTQERDLRVRGRDDRGRVQLLAAAQDDAAHEAVGDGDLLDGRARAHFAAESHRGAPDGLGDRPHATHRIAPRAEVSVADVADRVVGHDVGRARLVGAGPGADDPVDREHALQLGALEPAVEEIADARRHEAGRLGGGAYVEAAHSPREAQHLEQIARTARAQLRRRLQEERTEHVGEPRDPRLVVAEVGRVVLRELRHLFDVAARLVLEQQRAPVGKRDVGRTHRQHSVSVPLEIEVAQDRRRHEAHHVRERRHLELRPPRLLGARRAADVVASFEHDRAQTGASEIRARDQPVVTAADDDRVVVIATAHGRTPS